MPTRFSEQSDRCVPGAIICLFFLSIFLFTKYLFEPIIEKKEPMIFFFLML